MKCSILKNFSLFAVFVSGSAAFAALPARDPHPTQLEANAAEVESRREGVRDVAVPLEPASFFSFAGFRDDAPQVRASDEAPAETNGDDGVAFCHTDRWSTACLTGLIVYRCGQYTFPLTPLGCAMAAAQFTDLLQMKRISVNVEGTDYVLPVIFTERLEHLIRDRNTQMDLQSLRILLANAAQTKSKFDLWQWVWASTNGDFDRTLEKLAVLLQDTSGVAIQVNYLKGVAKARRFDAAANQAIADLEEVAYQLNSDILADEDYRSWLRLYPSVEIERDTTPLVYHFYPMAFTARLLQRGLNGNRLSAFIPFLFNTEYLNQTLDPEAWPFHHPKPFKIDSDELRWKMRDMYGGYAGARFGVRKTKKLPGLESFQTGYAKKPYGTMRYLFWTM